MAFKVLVCDDLSEEGLDIFKQDKNFEVVVKLKQPVDVLLKEIADADACVVRSGTQLTKPLIDAAAKLKVIGRAGVGLDNVDVQAASKKGVVVINTPGGNTISAAEHTFCLLMSIARNIPQANSSMKKGEWERKKFTGIQLYEKTLGVLGLGRIGAEVAKRAHSFGMKVIAYDPFLIQEKALQMGVELVRLEELLAQSDFLSLHMPLTAENKYIIGEKELQKVKKGVRIINCARGGLIDEKALAAAIESGHVAGAALDVFEEEPPKNTALIALPKVVATPHLGASTEEAQIAVAVEVAQCIVDYLNGRGLKNAANVPSMDPEALKKIQPYISLGEKLGLLQAQLIEGQIEQMTISYQGEIAQSDITAVTVAIIKGLLTPILAESVNFVNAAMLAKERGIKIIESKSSGDTSFSNLIQVSMKTDKKNTVIAGTVFAKDDLRIVKIDQFDIEVHPEGYSLLITNNDVPGIVGQIGTVLGNHRINIAGMSLGRDHLGGVAKTLLKIDSAIDESVMKDIRKSKNILDAKLLKF